MCNITDANILNFFTTFIGEGWEQYQFFCPVRNLAASGANETVNLSRNTPKINPSNDENTTNVKGYTISWNPDNDDDDVVIDL